MIEYHFGIGVFFFPEMCTKHCKSIGPPPKAITWDHTPQSMKLGLNQPNTVMHIHRTGKSNERNATCGALLARSLSFFFRSSFLSFLFFSLSLSLSLWVSLSLSLCRFCGKCPLNNVIRSRGYLATTLAII